MCDFAVKRFPVISIMFMLVDQVIKDIVMVLDLSFCLSVCMSACKLSDLARNL